MQVHTGVALGPPCDSACAVAGESDADAGDVQRTGPFAEQGAEYSGDSHDAEDSSLSVTLSRGIALSRDMAASEGVSPEKAGNATEEAELGDEWWQSASAQRSSGGGSRQSFEFQPPSQVGSEIGKFSLGLGPKSDSLQASKTLSAINLCVALTASRYMGQNYGCTEEKRALAV